MQQTAAKYAQAGFEVYLNWDGRIGGNGYVANFGDLTQPEIQGMANATASQLCADPNVQGMGWFV